MPDHPAVQAGVIPFVVGLVLAVALRRTRFVAAVPWAGFLATAALALGFGFEPLTAVRKLVLAGAVAGLLALALEAATIRPGAKVRAALAALCGAAALWVAWRVLVQREGAALALAVVATAGYAGGLAWLALGGARDVLRAAVVGAVLGLASGVLGLLAASVALLQAGVAVGAACGALALVLMVRGTPAVPGHYLIVPVVTVCALVGVGSVSVGGLGWPALVPLLALPLAARWVPRQPAAWRDAALAGLAALVPAALAVALAWARVGAAST